MGNVCPAFRQMGGGWQRALSGSAPIRLPLAQNNPYAKVHMLRWHILKPFRTEPQGPFPWAKGISFKLVLLSV